MEAKFETLDCEAFCLLHFAMALEDEKLWEKIIVMDNPTYVTTAKLIAKYDSTLISMKAIKVKRNMVDPIAAYSNMNRQPPNNAKGGIQSKCPCPRYGLMGHWSSQCNVLARGQ